MNSSECYFPGCKQKVKGMVPIKVKEKDYSVSFPFCEYHLLIAVGGDFHAIEKGKEKWKLQGPIDTVKLIEQVVGSIKTIEKKNGNDEIKK